MDFTLIDLSAHIPFIDPILYRDVPIISTGCLYMNIIFPVPNSCRSELFDDQCRCRTEYSIDFSLEMRMGNEIDRVAVTGNGNENRRITESTVRLDARILGSPQSLS